MMCNEWLFSRDKFKYEYNFDNFDHKDDAGLPQLYGHRLFELQMLCDCQEMRPCPVYTVRLGIFSD